MSEAKADTVPGLGFKDKDKALETIKNLEGRDPDYQKLAIKGLIGRAKRVLTLTKDKEKLQNINDAMATFEDWLKTYEKSNLSKENRAYLPLNTVESLTSLKSKYKISDKISTEFIEVYKKVKGEYKNLRTESSGDGEPTWDIVRNKAIKNILAEHEKTDPKLWDGDFPSKEHVQLILWAYSPEASKIKKSLDSIVGKLGKSAEKADKTKRQSESSENSDEEESPKKKSKK